jgi:hypothetical protein
MARNEVSIEASTYREPLQHVSVDGSTFIAALESYSFLPKPERDWRSGTIDLVRAYALVRARAGEHVYLADEFGQTIWCVVAGLDGSLSEPKYFAGEGEAGTAVDADGDVYFCTGQIFVYDREGKSLGVIKIPERSSALAFGGAEHKTHYVAARGSIYSIPIANRPQ